MTVSRLRSTPLIADSSILICSARQARSARIALLVPPTLSSLRDEKRVPSLPMHCSLRSLRPALVSRCLPHSLADEERVCALARPGQRRASLAQHGGARSEFDCSARQARCVWWLATQFVARTACALRPDRCRVL